MSADADQAARAAELANLEPSPAPDMTGGKGKKSGKKAQAAEQPPVGDYEEPIAFTPEPPLKPHCPVKVLGKNDGKFWFLSNRKELRGVDDKFPNGIINDLFGTALPWADWHYPQWVLIKDDDGKPAKTPQGKLQYERKGYHQADLKRALQVEADRQGIFSHADKVRGAGAHRGADGELILHCGDTLLITPPSDRRPYEQDVGYFGGLVFPARAKQPLPDRESARAEEGHALKRLIGSWRWKHPGISEHLALGWLAVAMIGGAVDYRPHIWVTGDSGTGKSTMQMLFREILFGLGLFISKGTAAGVRQSLLIDTIPVMFDEPEAGSTQQENITKIIEMARISSTGDKDVMGSQDHQAKEFVLRSTFFFSSIIVSKMEPQDRNRMAILELSPFPPNTEKLKIPTDSRALGRRLRRRMMQEWHRWDATVLTFQAALKMLGCNPREQDVYGTLLAAADMLLEDGAPLAASSRVAESVAALSGLLNIAQADNERHSERCLGHLRTSRLTSASGQHQESVSRWIHKAIIEILNAPLSSSARQKLLTSGLKIVTYSSSPDPKEPDKIKHSAVSAQAADFSALSAGDARAGRPCTAPDVYLAVAGASHRGVAEIFESAASYRGGGWLQALATLPGAIKESTLKIKYEGGTQSVVLVPIADMLDLNDARTEALGEEEQRLAIQAENERALAAKEKPPRAAEAAKREAYEAQIGAKRAADDDGGWPEGS